MIGKDLVELVHKRCRDLYCEAQQETVQLILLQIHHTLPLLASTCLVFAHYPLSKHLKSSRDLVASRLHALLQDLETHVGSGSPEYDMDEAGYFLGAVDQTLLLLIGDEEVNEKVEVTLKTCDLVKPLLEKILKHCIAVSHCCTDSEDKGIILCSENVLKQMKNLIMTLKNRYVDPIDINISRDCLVDAVEILEQKTNTALIRLIVQTFGNPLGPMKNLMELIDSEDKRDELDLYISKFDLHMDNIFQIGGFVTACTTNTERVQSIRNNLMTLEWLETCFIVAVQTAISSSHDHSKLHAQILARHWEKTVINLGESLDQILDASSFCLVTKQEIHKGWAKIKEKLYTQDMDWLTPEVNGIVMLSERVVYLNKKMDFLTDKQLSDIKSAISEIDKSFKKVLDNPTDLAKHRSLLKRIQLILTTMADISLSLNEENASQLDQLDEKYSSGVRTEQDKEIFLTSDIGQIPVDFDTPAPKLTQEKIDLFKAGASIANLEQKKSNKTLKRSSFSLSKIGELRPKCNTSNMSLATSSRGNTMGGDNTSIDITKFLNSRSSIGSSIRSSKRNFSLKVKEIDLDISEILQIEPTKETSNKVTNKFEKSIQSITSKSSVVLEDMKIKSKVDETNYDSLRDVSALIEEQNSFNKHKNQASFAGELTGIYNLCLMKIRFC